MPELPLRPALGTLRERALLSVLDRRAAYERKWSDTLEALQDRRAQDLSLSELERQRRAIAYYRSAMDRADELVETIRAQNRAIDEARRADPLEPARDRSRVPHRSPDRDRATAILGILEYERRRNAPLRRDAFDRAKALAASRGKFDLRQAYRKSGTDFSQSALFRGEAGFYDLKGVDMDVPPGPDPCEEMERRQRNRREVMFATGFGQKGYGGRHYRRIC